MNSQGEAMKFRTQQRRKLHYNGNPISIFQDFTANVVKARAALTDVRRFLRDKPGILYGIFFPARLRITYNNEEKEFVDATKAMDFVKKNLLSTQETRGINSVNSTFQKQ